jgi:NAD dependent epimerase/dehydratase
LKNRPVFVTGAEGFIGSHLVETLLARGYRVKAGVCYNSFGSIGWLEALDRRSELETVAFDVRDQNAVRGAMKGCGAAMHLAALIAIPYSYAAPESYVDVNVKGTLNVLGAARDLGLEKVVCTSTSEVYGTAQFVPITEEHPLVGQSPYAASKIGADQMAIAFHRSFETPVAIARPFNTFGPRQSLRAVIPTIVAQLASGARTLALGDVTPTRDFNYVEDTAAGLVAVLESPNTVGETVNLGTGWDVSIGDTARLIGEIMGRDFEIAVDPARIRPAGSEVRRLQAATGKAERLLDWHPAHAGPAGFRRALERTVAWFVDPANLARYRAREYVL